ncbi:MAG: tetratricopeptide repeat protein [Candidatus Schekmanbacteria bacterium]|nr:tetratricopeptide repeat protein [Candidatus Schekmanbacteria bacterium]
MSVRRGSEVTGLSERLGCEVLVGTAMPAEPGPDRRPLGLFLEPLRIVAERCHAGGIAETERVIAERGGVLAQFQPLIRELCAASGAFAEVTELPPDAARLRLFTYLEQTLAAVAEPRPLVLLLDDLQWADALSAAAVRHLATARRSASRRLLLIAATRPRSLGAGEAEVAPATGAQELTLPHLSEAALHQVIADMLGVRAAPREFVGYVAKQSGGNPYFAAEYLRAAIASSLLLMDHRGGWRWSGGKQPAARLALPASLGQAMALRLGELDASATSVAQIAAVLGGEQAADLLGAVLGGEEDRFARALHALVTADVLEEQRPGALRFCHDELRRLAQEGVSEARRREIQERAAVAMEAAGMSADATVAGTLGLRWEAAGRPERARPYFLAAARHAASRYSPAEAARLFAAYFRTCDGATEESISARLAYATEALGYGQDPDAADSQLRLAMAEAAALGARGCEAEALHRLGKMHLDAGDLAGSSRHQAAALKIWEEIADRSGQARAWLEMAQIALDRGDAEEAMALCTRARDHCRGAGDDRHEGIALAYAGIIAHDQADYAAAEQYSREALAIHTRIGDRRGSGNTLNNLALVLAEMGRRGEALALYEEALQTHRAVGHRLSEGTTLANMARLLGEAGEVGRARHLFRESLRIQKETANHANRGFTFFDLAVLERRAGTGPARLARLLDRAEAIADSAAARLLAVLCACERGHHALLQRQDTADLIAAVKESAAALGVDLREATEAGRALGRLQRAMRAVERGAPLLHGECPDTIPAGLRGQVGDPSAGGSP